MDAKSNKELQFLVNMLIRRTDDLLNIGIVTGGPAADEIIDELLEIHAAIEKIDPRIYSTNSRQLEK